MYNDLINLLGNKRKLLVEGRVRKDFELNLAGKTPYDTLLVVYNKIMDSIIEYLQTNNLQAYADGVSASGKTAQARGTHLNRMLESGTNFRNDIILLIETTYAADALKCERYKRRITSLQAVSYSTLVRLLENSTDQK